MAWQSSFNPGRQRSPHNSVRPVARVWRWSMFFACAFWRALVAFALLSRKPGSFSLFLAAAKLIAALSIALSSAMAATRSVGEAQQCLPQSVDLLRRLLVDLVCSLSGVGRDHVGLQVRDGIEEQPIFFQAHGHSSVGGPKSRIDVRHHECEGTPMLLAKIDDGLQGPRVED